MVLSRLTKITGPGVSTDTNWVGNNADFTGITTSGTSFNIGVTTIHSTLIEAHNIKSTGIITATGAHFSGNVSIAGTFTYEDVTNVDSIGIITARSQLNVGNNIKLGNAGVITATSFVGDGSGLIGVASTDNIVTGTAATFTGGVDINSDLDVDGHTNLDNVSIAGVTTYDANVKLNTNKRLYFGSSGQFYMYYQSSGSTFFESGAGGYLIHRYAVPGGGHENMIEARPNSSVLLFFNGSEKIKTVSKGIQVGTGVTIETNGQATYTGIVTATSFSGDGSNLTGITQTTINNNADNRVITGSGTANTLEADANLTWNNSTGQLVVGASGSGYISVRKPAIAQVDIQHSTTNSYSRLYMSQSSGSGGYFAINKLGTVDAGYTGGANAVQLWSSANAPMLFATNNSEKVRITSDGKLGVGVATPTEIFHIKKNDAGGPTITLENNANKAYINNWGSTGGGSGRTNRFEINATSQAQASICAPYITFMTGGVGDSYEKVRITGNGDLKLSGSTPLSSPSTSYKRISIGNNLILNAPSGAGGYTGFQNNAYVNSSGNWVRVNNDYASSIGMDDGNIYFRNVGAGTGNISWSMPLQIYANGTSTFGSTVTVNGHILSQGTSGRGGIFGQIQVGYSTLYNSIQNTQANTPIHLQYNNTGDVKCNEGGGDLRTADIIPHSNNSSNLGSSTRRWANIHTNDLNLSNEGNSNEVDGTWGQYTIQEGQDDLFLINRRSGKRYKFLLQEID